MSFKNSDAYRAARENSKYFDKPYVVFVDTNGNWRSNVLTSGTQQCFAVVYPDGRELRSTVETTVNDLIKKLHTGA